MQSGSFTCSIITSFTAGDEWWCHPPVPMEALTPKKMIYGDRTFGRWAELDKVMRMGPCDALLPVLKGTWQSLLSSLHVHPSRQDHGTTQQEGGHLQDRKSPSQEPKPCWTAILDFMVSRAMRSKFLLGVPICGICWDSLSWLTA